MIESLKIRIRHKDCDMQLSLNNKITIIIGNSATGKSSIHKMLDVKDAKVVKKCSDNGFKVVHLNSIESIEAYTTIKVEKLSKDLRLTPKRVYIIDENDIRINDVIASIIKNTVNSYFIITSRSNLNKLNYDIDAVKILETRNDGITVLKNYMPTKKIDNIPSLKLDCCVIEDKGKARVWFEALLADKVKVITAGSTDKFGNVDKVKIGNSGEKEKVCSEVEKQIINGKSQVLIVFDACSFGCCLRELKSLMDRYTDKLFILSNYKCWEYVILKSNLFKDKMSEYSLNIPEFEEAFYEDELYNLSSGVYTTVNHDSGDLPKCYTHKCCVYNRKNKQVCNLGLHGEDKFIALL